MSATSVIDVQFAALLARRLRTLREERRLTQEQLALAANINRNHYQLLESGISSRKTNAPANPRLSTLIALANVLGVSILELLDDAPLRLETPRTETQRPEVNAGASHSNRPPRNSPSMPEGAGPLNRISPSNPNAFTGRPPRGREVYDRFRPEN